MRLVLVDQQWLINTINNEFVDIDVHVCFSKDTVLSQIRLLDDGNSPVNFMLFPA